MKRWSPFVRRSCPRLNFQIDGAACLLGALALLMLPIHWIAAAVIAAGVHEACHLIALKLCGCRLAGFSIGSSGATIETEPLSPVAEMICSLAGPLGSLALLLVARWMPHIALCAAVQGIFNLLPVPALDGGRAAFLLVEVIRRKPLSPRVEGYIHAAGLALLLLLMVIISFKDVFQLIF